MLGLGFGSWFIVEHAEPYNTEFNQSLIWYRTRAIPPIMERGLLL